MVSKTKFPGICNNCGKRSEYYIRCGIHTLQLCGTCLNNLALEARTLIVKSGDQEQAEYNNSIETGLIKTRCSAQMIAEAGCDSDPNCHKCWTDTNKVPPTGGVI